MEVHYDEGIAIYIGPEPCVGLREGVGEASAGECIGQPLSRVRFLVPGADTVAVVEGNTHGHDIASARAARCGRRTWRVQTLLVSGNRENSRSTARSKAAGPRREGEEP